MTRVREWVEADRPAWETWVRGHAAATLFHRPAWREVIAATFGHRPVYLLAEDESGIRGVLPLFVLRTGLFGTMAVSLPFLNYGGVAADDPEAARLLVDDAARRGRENGCAYVEFRHRYLAPGEPDLPTNTFKVTSVLDLTGGAEDVWKTKLHQNVRNKIRKGQKSDLDIRRGPAVLGAFYHVFSVNQRDHGTPVLPKKFFVQLLARFGDTATVLVAYRQGRPVGAKLFMDFGATRYFIWSASVPEGNQAAVVPLMNWLAIEDAVQAGLQAVDMGRSTVGSSSQSFKKYWGVSIEPLYWQYHLLARDEMPGLNTSNPKFEFAIRVWRRLPLFATHWFGPLLAKRLP